MRQAAIPQKHHETARSLTASFWVLLQLLLTVVVVSTSRADHQLLKQQQPWRLTAATGLLQRQKQQKPSLFAIGRGGGKGQPKKQQKTAAAASSSSPAIVAAAAQPPTPAALPPPPPSSKIVGGTASVPSEIFNLLKAIVGAGVLGLPAGMAALGSSGGACTLIPALTMLAVIGMVSAFSFYLIAVVCQTQQATTYMNAWKQTVGEKTAWLPALCCTLVTLGSVVCYSMILADTVPSLLQAVLGIRGVTRTAALLGVTAFLLPLCCMRELHKLAPFSMVGIGGMVYTCGAMLLRYFLGSYKLPTGHFVKGVLEQAVKGDATASAVSAFAALPQVPFLPNFDSNSCFQVNNAAIFLSMLATAYMAHYNAPKLYWELENTNLSKFATVVSTSFTGALVMMGLTAAAGYMTFGGACQSVILSNYAVGDKWMMASRVAVAISLLAGYPLAFVGVRDGVLDVLQVSAEKRSSKQFSDQVTFALLAMITTIAFLLNDIGIILAFGGATWGNAVVYLFPAVMIYKAHQKAVASKATDKNAAILKTFVVPAVVTGIIGLCLGTVGTYRAVASVMAA